jgi:adenosylcobyric acid synthase
LEDGRDSCHRLCETTDLGWWRQLGNRDGIVAGTYLHGVFETGPWRRRWLNQLRQRQQLTKLPEMVDHHRDQRERLLDRLADAFEADVNLSPLLGRPLASR